MITRAYFEHLLEDPLTAWSAATKPEMQDQLGPEAAAMVKFDQHNPHHCYDLLMHTLHVTAGINSAAERVRTSLVCLRAAAFFHDIGKPATARERDGRLVFYGHPQKSAEIAAPILASLGYERDESELILFFIRHHDDFISYVLPDEKYDRKNQDMTVITKKAVLRHISKTVCPETAYKKYDIWNDMLLLCGADMSAQAENVYINGILTATRKKKLERMQCIAKHIQSAEGSRRHL